MPRPAPRGLHAGFGDDAWPTWQPQSPEATQSVGRSASVTRGAARLAVLSQHCQRRLVWACAVSAPTAETALCGGPPIAPLLSLQAMHRPRGR